MTNPLISDEEFDLAPHPRILPMLGEITLHQWQCCAELLDNSIDGFLKAARAGGVVTGAEVRISLPTGDSVASRVEVADNGPGMDAGTLQNAVKAGWTSNDPTGNLGLFGMGFNIATAKLGRKTTVWTSRAGDTEEVGLEIDFDRLTAVSHFRTRRLHRPKVDPSRSGTTIVVERLKHDQRMWFVIGRNRTQIVKKLGEVYSSMLRPGGSPIELSLYVNNIRVQAWTHCVWGNQEEGSPDRSVAVSNGQQLAAFQRFDVPLNDRPFCQICWQWLTDTDSSCPSCANGGNVVRRARRVHGWLGIQRYVSEDEYGIDFLRNGRKIEVKNKDLFFWRDPLSDQLVKEYPIDDMRPRGRIVGEVHVDHCRVNYTKSRFDRDDSSWEDAVAVIRGQGPLRPNIAVERGYNPASNGTPLYRLYQGFRRASPHSKSAGCYARLLVVPPEQNDEAVRFAQEYRKGTPQYQSDQKWWDLVEQADQALLLGSGTTGRTAPAPRAVPQGFLPTGGTVSVPMAVASTASPAITPAAPVSRSRNAMLSREYRDRHSSQRWDVEAFSSNSADPDLAGEERAWSLQAEGTSGRFRYVYNPDHEVFRSVTLTPLDALLAEIAHRVIDFSRSRQQVTYTYAHVLADLRQQYASASRLDPTELAGQARATIEASARKVSGALTEAEAAAAFSSLSESEKETLYLSLVQSGIQDPEPIVKTGRFVGYLRPSTLVEVFERHPDFFLDSRCWDEAYAQIAFPGAVAATARTQVKRRYLGLLSDVAWLAEADLASLVSSTRERLLRGAIAVEQLSLGD
jgi:hypothetical protein